MNPSDQARTWATESAGRAVDSAAIPRLIPATVADPLVQEGLVVVVVDGDTDPIEVQNLTGRRLVPDDRVMVLFAPPSGAFVLAVIGDPGPTAIRWDSGATTTCTTGVLTSVPPGTALDPASAQFGVFGPIFGPQLHGWYDITATVEFASNATGDRFVDLWRTGGTDRVLGPQIRAASGATTIVSVHGMVWFGEGDYLEVRARQSSGGDLDASLRHLVMARRD